MEPSVSAYKVLWIGAPGQQFPAERHQIVEKWPCSETVGKAEIWGQAFCCVEKT